MLSPVSVITLIPLGRSGFAISLNKVIDICIYTRSNAFSSVFEDAIIISCYAHIARNVGKQAAIVNGGRTP